MKQKGYKFAPGTVIEWLDCGNKDATVYTNQRMLELNKNKKLISSSFRKENSVIIEPCFIDDNVAIINSVVGPYVSVGKNSKILNSVVHNSIIQNHTTITFSNIDNSMLGNYVEYKGVQKSLSIGDYSTHNPC